MAPLRPRDRKWTLGETWRGWGRHGEGDWEEEMRLELLEETENVVDGPDAFDESVGPLEEHVDDEVVDRELEDPLLKGPLPHPHQ